MFAYAKAFILASLTLACLVNEARALRIAYNGHDMADLDLTRRYLAQPQPAEPQTETQYRVDVYRDNVKVYASATYTNRFNKYWHDAGLSRNRSYVYTAKYWRDTGSGWTNFATDGPVTARTDRCKGYLYNSINNRFGRPPISWSGEVVVDNVYVVEGLLRIHQGATVVMRGNLESSSGSYNEFDTVNGELQAIRVTFRKHPEYTGSGNPTVKLYRGAPPSVWPSFTQCILDGVDVGAHYQQGDTGLQNAYGLEITDNVFKSGATLGVGGGIGLVSGNTGMKNLRIGYWRPVPLRADDMPPDNGASAAQMRVFRDNQTEELEIFNRGNHVEGNHVLRAYMRYSCAENVVVSNTFRMLRITGTNNVISHNLFPYESGAGARGIYCYANSNIIEHNTLESAWIVIQRSSSQHAPSDATNNVVRHNFFTAPVRHTSGGVWAAGAHNLIYDNFFSARLEPRPGRDDGVNNRWFVEKTAGPNIVNGPFIGGNYWGSYEGVDEDGDGFGDTPMPLHGDAGTQDELPLMGAGELFLEAAGNNPAGNPVTPHGQPFPVTRLRIEGSANMPGPARISGMTFEFHGTSNRIPMLAGAALFAGNTNADDAMNPIAVAGIANGRMTFRFDDYIAPGGERFYALAYGLRYEDEYTAPGLTLPAGESAGTPFFGGALNAEDVLTGSAILTGSPVRGFVRPSSVAYISALPAMVYATMGRMIENTSVILNIWNLHAEIPDETQPAILLERGSGTRQRYIWIKDRHKVHVIGPFADQPLVRLYDGLGQKDERYALPTSEILDAHLDAGGRPRWSRGPAYEDPYVHDELRFSGEVYLHATATMGNFQGLQRDVLTPLQRAFTGYNDVILAHFRIGPSGGYYALVRVRTEHSILRVLEALPGAPRVVHSAGRTLLTNIDESIVEHPAYRIHAWGNVAGDPITAADYDGDGNIDPAIFIPGIGLWQIWLSASNYRPATAAGWGGSGAMAVSADYDGDGKADPAVYEEYNGAWRVWLSSQNYQEMAATGWGGPGYVPVPADYDGDGKADPAVYEEATGTWRVWLSSQGYREMAATGWGGPGYVAAPADYDGDGKADPAVYEEATGTWRVWLSSQGYREMAATGWGGPGLKAVPADYDGDGKADPAVMEPLSGRRAIWRSKYGYALFTPDL